MTFPFICRTAVQLYKPHRTVFVMVLFLDYIPVKSQFYRKITFCMLCFIIFYLISIGYCFLVKHALYFSTELASLSINI